MLGTISSWFKKRWVLPLFLAQFVIVVAGAEYFTAQRSSAGCIACHGNREKMEELEYPQFYVTQEMAERESRHRNVQCHECHYGNGLAKTADKAHEGMLKAIYIDYDGDVINRKEEIPQPLVPTGDDAMRAMLPKEPNAKGILSVTGFVRNVLFHDRNPKTLGYDPALGRKACGRSGCHPKQVAQFSGTVMGANYRQRTMKTWMKPYGPHNCGPSFADTQRRETAVGDRFDFQNQQQIARELNVPFFPDQAVAKQKLCNVCHAGCTDCHYTPFKGEGVHSFSKIPPAESCAGGGRNSSICHTGTMERRRGDTYLGGDYSEPPGMAPDVHVKEKIPCVGCHLTGVKGMGDIERKATCGDCHIDAEYALSESEHKKVSCEACHVSAVGGYQLTHWGPGDVAGVPNPMTKYPYYYGIFSPPIVMKDQTGLWIPVKPWPHSVAHFQEDVAPVKGLQFRWPGGETRDSYALLGTFDGLPAGNKHLAWIQIEQVAHPYGKSRDCDSCHGEVQRAESTWRFFADGVRPFTGSHRVLADNSGLHLYDIKADSEILAVGGKKLTSFAPWVYLGDIWKIEGDFSIPGEGYEVSLNEFRYARERLEAVKTLLPEQEFGRLRSLLVHNPKLGLTELSVGEERRASAVATPAAGASDARQGN